MVFHGYTDPDLNAEAFDDEGYFRTGTSGGCARTVTSSSPDAPRT